MLSPENYVLLRKAAQDMRELAQLCLTDAVGACWHRRAEDKCITREERRLRGAPKLPAGLSSRPDRLFDPTKLCDPCAAYWHASQAANKLQQIVITEQVIAMEEGRCLPQEVAAIPTDEEVPPHD